MGPFELIAPQIPFPGAGFGSLQRKPQACLVGAQGHFRPAPVKCFDDGRTQSFQRPKFLRTVTTLTICQCDEANDFAAMGQRHTQERGQTGVPFRCGDAEGARRRIVAEEPLAYPQYAAEEPVDYEVACRPAMSGLVAHRARLPAGIADGDIVQQTVWHNLCDESELAAGDFLRYCQAGHAKLFVRVTFQGLIEDRIDSHQHCIALIEFRVEVSQFLGLVPGRLRTRSLRHMPLEKAGCLDQRFGDFIRLLHVEVTDGDRLAAAQSQSRSDQPPDRPRDSPCQQQRQG